MADQALNAPLQGDGGGGAAGAGPVHRKIQMPVTIALVGDIAAVLGDRWPDAGLDQLLDLVDDVGVGRVFLKIAVVGYVDTGGSTRHEQWRAADEMVEQRLKNDR